MLDFDQGRIGSVFISGPASSLKRKTVDFELKNALFGGNSDQQTRRQVVDTACAQALIRRLKAAVLAVVVVRN